jgi:tripartite-type tricarboxylate transporter receptor subunit TctC
MTRHSRRQILATLAGASLGLALPHPARAQAFPGRPITIVVPFPPGGTTDITARILAAEMSQSLGQTVIVENKGGANGNVGSAQVAKAAADGHTLLMSGIGSNAINHGIYKAMTYDSRRDFAHVILATSGPNVLLVHPGFAAKTLEEFIARVKASPGKFSYASNGNGSSGHLAMELLKRSAGLDIVHVPYRGGGPALQDLIGGKIEALFTNQDVAFEQVRAGTVRALGVASPARNPAMPDLPTIAEQGLPGFAAVSWNGLSAPAGTPRAVIDILNRAAAKALQLPAVRDKLVANGFVIEASTPERYTELVASEIEKWGRIAREAGITIDS